MSNRFELEQEILNCWRLVDDLHVLRESISKMPENSDDKVDCILLGLATLYELRFDKLWGKFEQVVAEIDALQQGDISNGGG
jgi:hypothetical protein